MNDQTIWHIAAGDGNRVYYDLCLRWDVVIVGPGYAGVWPECEEELSQDKASKDKVRRFCKEIQDGDMIVLNLGKSKVYGIGHVVGLYHWMDAFGDVDGWDLQHVRRVRWLWRYDQTPDKLPMDFTGANMSGTINRINSEEILERIRNLKFNDRQMNRPLVELPDSCSSEKTLEEVNIQTIANYLFDAGVAADSIDALVNHMDNLRRIASWYTRNDLQPSESETVAYLVVPLLRALGWTPQRMAVEWNNIDLALFDHMPRENRNLSIVAEAKAIGKACLIAESQAKGYAEQEEREQCRRLIVTDGIRYGIYLRHAEGKKPATSDSYKLEAYLNLTRMMDDYPVLECKGTKEALTLMAADWRGTPST